MSLYAAVGIGVLVMWVVCCVPGAAEPAPAAPRQSAFVAMHDVSHWAHATGDQPGPVVLTAPEMDAPLPWNQLVASWNATLTPQQWLKFEARALYPDHATKYYTMGLWSPDSTQHPRESVKDQADADGDVQTDTLVLKQPAERLQLRITLGPTAPDADLSSVLKFVGLSLLNSTVPAVPLAPNRAAWGKVIDVPQRSQVSYPGGTGWCSPTCVSMDLAHWSRVLNRAELNQDVPEVAHGVYDQAWGGTGNWPFNTAFAGSFPGLRAYVSRFSDVCELEDWIAADIPVIVSVSYDLLKGKPEARDAGHLIMCVGFTGQGDIIVNDPWARLENGETVRKTFPRQNLIPAWNNSQNTVYLIYPATTVPPKDRFGHWDTNAVPVP